MAITYHNDIIYLFILTAPDNMYRDTWSIDLVKTNIITGKHEVLKKFITAKEGWYHAKALQVFFREDAMLLAWIDGRKVKDNPESNMYRLQPVVYRGYCSYTDRQCTDYFSVYRGTNYNDIDIRLAEPTGGEALFIKEKDAILVQIKKERQTARTIKHKAYYELFTRRRRFPFTVTCGP